MDSGNSGSLSLQSSSGGGGDDEFDSRCGGGGEESPLAALLRQPPPAPSSVLPGFGGSFYGIQELATPPQPMSHWSSTTPLPGSSLTAPQSSSHLVPTAPASADQSAPPPRGSRKRTRASRRAPTTVLTTDTSNFRAMVQEFTGVPAPPFAPARSRFDHLYPSHSGGNPAAALSPYILRPFAQKLQAAAAPYPPPFIAMPSTSANKAIASSTAVASSDRYQLASAPPAVLGIQDHSSGGNYLSFQSPIGAQPDGNARYPVAHPIFDAAGPPSSHQRLRDPAGFMDLAHGQMNSEGTMHMHPRHGDHGHGGDELAGLVRAASVSIADEGCKATSYSSGAGSAAYRAGPPLLDRNARSTTTIPAGAATTTTTPVAATPGMRAQGVESSWICTSE